MRARHGVYMYKGYQPWNLEKFLRLENNHSIHWKQSSRRDRPLCGSRCRDGHACKAKAVVNLKTDKPVNGRCRMHGGLSTGAKTQEGKARCREASRRGMLEYWKRKRESQGL
jgi:hypothetical protein